MTEFNGKFIIPLPNVTIKDYVSELTLRARNAKSTNAIKLARAVF